MPKPFAATATPTAPWHARRADEDYGKGAKPDWREVDWPAHLHQVEIEGSRVNYVDIGSGDGPAVVLVHGLGGQWQNWLENIPRVARERRVVALDLPGFGLSEMPSERISISGYGRCVDALVEHLGLQRVDVVGNSMGGFVASEVAIQFPERVERLALVSAAGISSANASRAPVLTAGRIATAVTAYTAARHQAIARRPVTRHFALVFVARHPSKLRSDLVWEGLMKGTDKPGFDDALRACLEYDFRDRLPEIRSPTLIVWGQNDSIIPARDAEEFERMIDDSRKVVLEDTGHIPMLERPAAFNDLLLEFLGEAAEPTDSREETAAA
jgi:pimeloyl-ACP methyl ester carboxylesterase